MGRALVEVLRAAHAAGIRMAVDGDRIVVRRGKQHAELVEELREHKPTLLELARLIESSAARQQLEELSAVTEVATERLDAAVVAVSPPLERGWRAKCFTCNGWSTKVEQGGRRHWCDQCLHLFATEVWTRETDLQLLPCEVWARKADAVRSVWELVGEDGAPRFAGFSVSRECAWALAHANGWEIQDGGAQ